MNRALDLADKELQAEKEREKQAEVLIHHSFSLLCHFSAQHFGISYCVCG
jgi:hypothetical protein